VSMQQKSQQDEGLAMGLRNGTAIASDCMRSTLRESIMQAWKMLFTSDVGLFTVAVFLVLFAMMAYFLWLFAIRKPGDESYIPHATHEEHAH